MIGLDSYSRQVLNYLDPHFDLYQSLNRLPIWNSQNCSMFPLAFVAGSLQGHWWGFISRNYVVWSIFFLMNVFIALKGTYFWFLIHLAQSCFQPTEYFVLAQSYWCISHESHDVVWWHLGLKVWFFSIHREMKLVGGAKIPWSVKGTFS